MALSNLASVVLVLLLTCPLVPQPLHWIHPSNSLTLLSFIHPSLYSHHTHLPLSLSLRLETYSDPPSTIPLSLLSRLQRHLPTIPQPVQGRRANIPQDQQGSLSQEVSLWHELYLGRLRPPHSSHRMPHTRQRWNNLKTCARDWGRSLHNHEAASWRQWTLPDEEDGSWCCVSSVESARQDWLVLNLLRMALV